MTKKYIIGLGCSWTQGEGGYTEDIWKSHGGRVQVRGRSDHYLRKMEHENSWVNVLCRDYFPEYTPINLGVRGIGNYAAVHQLYFCDQIDWNDSTGIIVLMLSGFERLDTFRQNPYSWDGEDDYYSKNSHRHYKWRTAWPFPPETHEDLFWECYAKELWSEQFVAHWQMMALLDLQTFAKANKFKMVIANGFNIHKRGIQFYLRQHVGPLANKFDWSCNIHETTPYVAFVQKLVWLDNLINPKQWDSFHNFYSKRDWPAKYLTNCEGAHPTLEGYKIIAEELSNFIKYKNYV